MINLRNFFVAVRACLRIGWENDFSFTSIMSTVVKNDNLKTPMYFHCRQQGCQSPIQ
jgi:hypothetical protein